MKIHIHTIPKKAKQHFSQLLRNCEWLKGCVAYWTIYPHFFAGKLAEVLSRKDSFYCVHLSSPTNSDALDVFYHEGANLLVYNYFWKSLLEEGKHPPLLHAKVAVFGMPNNEAVIWVGSHNFTQSALLDTNIEASTVITTTKDTDYYYQIIQLLNSTKERCDVYKPAVGKWVNILRGKKLERFTKKEIGELYNLNEALIAHFFKTQVISFVGKDISRLHTTNSLIQIIGLDKQFYRVFSIKQKRVFLLIRQPGSSIGYFYLASVVLTGDIDQEISDSYDMEFSTRRYAVLARNTLGAVLNKSASIKKEQLQQAAYVASLKIEQRIGRVRLKIFPYPEAAWKTVDAEDIRGKMSWQEREDLLPKKHAFDADSEKPISEIDNRQVKFKKLDASVEELTNEITFNEGAIDDNQINSLLNYYKERLAILEQKQSVLFESDEKEQNRLIVPPKFAECKQSNFGKIVVVMKKEE